MNFEFGKMTAAELLLHMASDLITELEKTPDEEFSFEKDTTPMKNTDMVKEIKNLTPLGKEIIANWFMGVQRNLEYLHADKILATSNSKIPLTPS